MSDPTNTGDAVDTSASVAYAPEGRDTSNDRDDDMYLHLANGDVVRVRAEEVPSNAGADAPHGYYEHNDAMHLVIDVHPVEVKGK